MRWLSSLFLRRRSTQNGRSVLQTVSNIFVLYILCFITKSSISKITVSSFQHQHTYNIREKLLQPNHYVSVDNFRIASKCIHTIHQRKTASHSKPSTTQLYFMGSDSGILGVGGPEVVLIVLVGYFVLGPSDLYKLVKEIGKFIQNIRTLGTDLSTTFENNMESTLQLEELRKAQRELNDAFSFRRSINVDADSDAFSVQAGSAQKAEAERLAAVTLDNDVNTTVSSEQQLRPKKIRRRIKKKEPILPDSPSMSDFNTQQSSDLLNNVPDLEIPTATDNGAPLTTMYNKASGVTDEEAAIIEAEFNQYVVNPMPSTFDDWDNWKDDKDTSDDGIVEPTNSSSTNGKKSVNVDQNDAIRQLAEQNRFQQQINNSWNEQILQAGDSLEPVAIIMKKIALLEQEKAAALRRIDEEYAQRTAIEEKYYKEQRQLLDKAARDVQSAAFGLQDSSKTII